MTPHVEIARTQRLLEDIFHAQRAYLATKPDAYLEDLRHRSQEAFRDERGLAQVAAGLNQAACELILEERLSRGGGSTEKSCSTCNPAAPVAPPAAVAGKTP